MLHVSFAHVTPILRGFVAPFPPIFRQNIFTMHFWNVNSTVVAIAAHLVFLVIFVTILNANPPWQSTQRKPKMFLMCDQMLNTGIETLRGG